MNKKPFIQILFALQFILTLNLYSQEPDWYDKVNVLSGHVPSVALTTGGTWGFSLDDAPSIREQVEYWHSLGGFYHAYFTFGNGWINHEKRINESLAGTDLYGNPIIYLGAFNPNLHNPAWQDSLIKWVKQIADLGADGIVIDGSSANIGMIYHDPAGSFDDFTMKDFRNYLQDKYSDVELSSKFNIQDISIFNFGNWIISNGLETTWNSLPLEGISYEFMLFEWKFAKNFLVHFAKVAKNYALTEYGKNFLIAENGANNYYFFVDIVDFQVNEFFYLDRPFLEYAASHTKLRKALNNKPIVILPEVAEHNNNRYKLVQNSNNMIKHVLSDIYASGGIAVVYDQFWCPQHYESPYFYNTNILKQYTTFILDHSDLYENLLTTPKVGLIYSYTSTWRNYPFSYRGMSKLLIDANIQHDVIFLNGPPVSDTTAINADYLSKYDCIILPAVHSISDLHESLLRQYIYNGGVVIGSGETCTRNENGESVVRPEWQSLTTDGTHLYGNGFFVYFSHEIGNSYTWGENHLHPSIIAGEINKYIEPQTIIDTENPPSIFLYEKENTFAKVMHLVNYDYDPNTDSFTLKENIPVKVQADTTRDWEAVCVSPDVPGQQLLPTTIENGYICFTVPHLEAYGIVVLQENQFSPTLFSYSPQGDTLIVAGSSIKFSVSVTDLDENPLYFQWYINDKLDSLATDKTFNYQTSIEASGTDTILVEITDGSNRINKQWFVHIREYVRPKIMFDESHDESNTISLERAKIINPDNPEWVYYGIIKDQVESMFTLDRNENYSLSSSLLSNYHALVLASPNSSFKTTELNDILSFVKNGGGLFIILDCGFNNYLSQLLGNFGIEQLDGVLFGLVNGNLSVTEFIDYKDLVHVQKFDMNWGSCLKVSEPSISVGLSSAQSWLDINWNGLKESTEPNGPFTIMCVAEYGNGKVCCISDNSFHDDYVKWESSQNDELFLNTLKWLTNYVNQIPTNVKNNVSSIPKFFELKQNYPNPFNPTTKIEFSLPKTSNVEIRIYNMLGQEIRTLVDKNYESGNHVVIWDGKDNFGKAVSSGLYLYSMKSGDFIKVNKGLLLK